MKRLDQIINHLRKIDKVINRKDNILVKNIFIDSRQVTKDSMFIALKGTFVNGHEYIEHAIKCGAKIIVCERIKKIRKKITYIITKDTYRFMNKISPYFFDNPQKKLKIVGVTGTNGKTSVTYIVDKILNDNGYRTGIIGTIRHKIGSRYVDSINTTPFSINLYKLLYRMVKARCDIVIMEVSSHSLKEKRIYGLEFDSAAITNIASDHLDYHKTLSDYIRSKLMILNYMKENSSFAFNGDDPILKSRLKFNSAKKVKPVSFGLKQANIITAKNILFGIDKSVFNLVYKGKIYKKKNTNLAGGFNIYNILCGISLTIPFGIELMRVLKSLESIPAIPGRFERIKNRLGFNLIVDYAHTEDAIKNLIKSVKATKPARIITVFGCGGDRDRTKRPKMGKVVHRNSDITVVTSDNPRTEEPQSIIQDILSGVQTADLNSSSKILRVITEREMAIKYSIEHAKKGDTIIIAGKGHEDYQIIGRKKIHFSDREIAEKYFKILHKRLTYHKTLQQIPPSEIVIDTRKNIKNKIFVALKGKNFDGHKFIDKAIKKKVRGIVYTSSYKFKTGKSIRLYPVPDTLKFLGDLASFHRGNLNCTVIGITGSNGKSTTKELIYCMLKPFIMTKATKGNQNNFIGLPMNFFRLNKNDNAYITEIATNHPGEIKYLARIARPDISVITNISPTHIQFFRTVQTIWDEKSDIFRFTADNGWTIINLDHSIISKEYKSLNLNKKVFTFSSKKRMADLYLSNCKTSLKGIKVRLEESGKKIALTIPNIYGIHNSTNLLASISIARIMGLSYAMIKRSLRKFMPLPGRLQVVKCKNGKYIVHDAYNSNITSACSMLDFIDTVFKKKKKIVVFSDMLELGKRSRQFHTELGKRISKGKYEFVLLTGRNTTFTRKAIRRSKVEQFECLSELKSRSVRLFNGYDLIAFKGSHGTGLYTVADYFVKKFRKRN